MKNDCDSSGDPWDTMRFRRRFLALRARLANALSVREVDSNAICAPIEEAFLSSNVPESISSSFYHSSGRLKSLYD